MNPDEQILGIVEVLQHAKAVNPDDAPFMLVREKLEMYPDHDAILTKLQAQYKVISIKQRPNEQNMTDVDIDLAEIELPDAVMRDYMSYSILVTPQFDALHDELASRAGSTNNRSSTTSVALQPDSYNKRTGVLTLAPNHQVAIARRGKVRKSTGIKYFECYFLEKLFSSKASLSNGVSFHDLLGKHKDKPLTKAEIKKVRNARTAINNKVTGVNGPKKLITIQGERIYINPKYLI